MYIAYFARTQQQERRMVSTPNEPVTQRDLYLALMTQWLFITLLAISVFDVKPRLASGGLVAGAFIMLIYLMFTVRRLMRPKASG
jgi:hypothetical protein